MKTTTKAVIQTAADRGYSNGDQNYLSNLSGEVTFNVVKGRNMLGYYYRLGLLKFASLEDALEYIAESNLTKRIGSKDGEEYYSLVKQDGCAFTFINSYIENNATN